VLIPNGQETRRPHDKTPGFCCTRPGVLSGIAIRACGESAGRWETSREWLVDESDRDRIPSERAVDDREEIGQ
jgi:hypothetical protein